MYLFNLNFTEFDLTLLSLKVSSQQQTGLWHDNAGVKKQSII